MAPAVMPQYVSKPDHRDGTRIKSQWTIALHQEFSSFETAYAAKWYVADCGWGLHLSDGSPQYLGQGARHFDRDDVPLFIARFDEGNPGVWHGCPADPEFHNHDVPPPAVLSDWVKMGYLTPAKQRRIMKSQRCAL